ncbi:MULTISPECIES: maltokinase N-terminal cap-like domain-containing protein [unclassified Streptomyces]|uniref:maltokinase N-terminal cap-like domain-containing protein n=1 Tax=unclassified Streptomyces TaxID=2593676 RepID=UPI00225835F4|nr:MULTISPECIES: maltokinase [unclassified Streptomyces]MCX5059886.1 maltokinase [Streptomyces sp. NBC_00452]MCX5252334.1 maltokinase [Streptomyces sp. NBC_00201]MCX5290797.1 maltokinase [Streptomyces sp. NBC_00183]
MQKTASLRPRCSVATGPMASLAGLLREWLPRQRWFAGKDRPVTDLGLLSVTELFPGCLHLLVHAGPTGVPAPSGAAPAGDCYQLLLGVRKHLSPRLGRALIGRAETGPLAGLMVYDALQDPRSAQLLLERLRRPGTAGPLCFEGDPSVQVPAGLVPRVLEAEQSNSSLVYGDAFILKVFRRIQPGVNPDLEVPGALAEQGCGRVPAPVAWFRTTHPQEATLGVLQPFLPDASDGWALALQALASGDDFTVQAHELGRATADVHLALAAAFPTGAHDESARTAAAMAERLDSAAHCVPALRPHVPGLRTAFGALVACDPGPPAQRIHGDLHLGQVLRAGRDWFVIDFEGEPSRPLAERRSAQSPVRDIAGMLRSFDYAARQRRPWRPEWARRCREAYCAGYAERAGWDPRKKHGLLRAYETDRAVYEVLYEARHRPGWLPVPMAAIERLAVRGG